MIKANFNNDNGANINLTDKLIESVVECNNDSKDFFYELMMNFTENWQIDSKDLKKEQIVIYQLIGKTFIKEIYSPFLEGNKN